MSKVETGYQKEGNRHIWFAKSELGGVHIWAIEQDKDWRDRWGERFLGGIEIHSPKPLYGDCQASHDDCWLLNAPCWHDGSSLQFSEQIEPVMRHCDDIREMDDYIIGTCIERYRYQFDHDEQPQPEFL
ncbi:hypothetical protein ATL17_1612 [Maritalea mobilis]|uniref:Uncharacterized protein n=1 Tax=Maritalea mobilis TaxID=483324 RepID=A0A4R6VJP5_9HYPH|nr:hypothetical protein [Maritalea mobilis]TDQ63605.1 hypothetical protein ATL17_1612 [Maritalea mobilis]